MKLAVLVGCGRKIGLLALPFLMVGTVTNILKPAWFDVGGPPFPLLVVSLVVMIPGIIIWAWSVYLILTRIPQKELITNGPYALMKHPLYTGVALFVLPWLGFLCNSWLGLVIGGIVYIGCRIYAPEEEKVLSQIFGVVWHDYTTKVLIPWL